MSHKSQLVDANVSLTQFDIDKKHREVAIEEQFQVVAQLSNKAQKIYLTYEHQSDTTQLRERVVLSQHHHTPNTVQLVRYLPNMRHTLLLQENKKTLFEFPTEHGIFHFDVVANHVRWQNGEEHGKIELNYKLYQYDILWSEVEFLLSYQYKKH